MSNERRKKTVFQLLFENNIGFAVGVGVNTFKLKSIEGCANDYFIIIMRKDLNKLNIKNFRRSSEYKNVFELDLSLKEIHEFKHNIDKFVKVKHDKFGKVFEYKSIPFKDYYYSNITMPEYEHILNLNRVDYDCKSSMFELEPANVIIPINSDKFAPKWFDSCEKQINIK